MITSNLGTTTTGASGGPGSAMTASTASHVIGLVQQQQQQQQDNNGSGIQILLSSSNATQQQGGQLGQGSPTVTSTARSTTSGHRSNQSIGSLSQTSHTMEDADSLMRHDSVNHSNESLNPSNIGTATGTVVGPAPGSNSASGGNQPVKKGRFWVTTTTGSGSAGTPSNESIPTPPIPGDSANTLLTFHIPVSMDNGIGTASTNHAPTTATGTSIHRRISRAATTTPPALNLIPSAANTPSEVPPPIIHDHHHISQHHNLGHPPMPTHGHTGLVHQTSGSSVSSASNNPPAGGGVIVSTKTVGRFHVTETEMSLADTLKQPARSISVPATMMGEKQPKSPSGEQPSFFSFVSNSKKQHESELASSSDKHAEPKRHHVNRRPTPPSHQQHHHHRRLHHKRGSNDVGDNDDQITEEDEEEEGRDGYRSDEVSNESYTASMNQSPRASSFGRFSKKKDLDDLLAKVKDCANSIASDYDLLKAAYNAKVAELNDTRHQLADAKEEIEQLREQIAGMHHQEKSISR